MTGKHRYHHPATTHSAMHDPIADHNRMTKNGQRHGEIMRTIKLSLVIGKKDSGVSTLLNSFAERADMQDSLIVDGDQADDCPPLSERWSADEIAIWLKSGQALGLTGGYHRIIIASADLRAPRHLLHALAAEPDLSAAFRLDAVTSVIAATDALLESEATGPSSRAAAIADRIVLTKTDQADPAMAKRLAAELKALNPPAPILRARHGDIGPARLVDSGLFDPLTGNVDIDRWLCEAAFGWEASRRGGSAAGLNLPGSTFDRLGDGKGVSFFAITLDRAVDSTVLSVFLKLLMADRGADLLRLKGIVATDEHPDRPALIDGREHIIQPLLWLPAWPTTDHRSRLVFVTTNISEAWIRSLLAMLADQLGSAEAPEPQIAMLEAEAG
ncbi:MAG: CobW family GTP-binding protein [Geminicoccaceae bacterium]